MGNKLGITIGGTALAAVFAAFVFLTAPSLADASRGERGQTSLASSIIEMVNQQLCERMSMRFSVPFPGRCGSHPQPEPEEPEPTVTISADPMTIEEGESATLAWDADNADSCEASGGWDGEKDTSGSESVSPDETTTYTITCEGDGGEESDSVTVTVEDAAPEPEEPSVEITADPMDITEGESTTLTWNSDAADSCAASGGWSGEKAVDGSQSVSPDETTTYTIECEGEGGTDSDSVTVTVTEDEPDMGTLIVRKLVIRDDGDTTATSSFSFEVNDGDAIPFESDGENSIAVEAGTYTVVETDADGFTADYDNCSDITISEGETETCTITNNDVDDAEDPTVNITASRTTVFEGSEGQATTTLSWDSTDADSCVASNGWSGEKAANGSETVTPTATTTYAITCTGDGGTAEDSVTVDFVEEDEEPAPSGNLLITEVMYDLATSTPAQGTETANEWIELYNGTDQTLDLTGYTITDAASSDTLPDGTLLEAGQFLLITSSSTTEGFYDIPEDAVIVVLTGAIGNGLGNAGDFLELRNDEGSAVDAVSWGDNTSAFSPAVPGVPTNVGYSIGRIDIDVDTGTAADWETKEDPSPGQE